ncbi:pyrimidine (deoxy)nucleoside triphosphate diphosphatase [Pantoea sp. 1.19]|uniref:pyrimidine (deoxy)nucleoside triphosphate diphosphatase n=1 Tax=Pantoea sp. 1.19 TaxID=1925589 RepID=UPI0009490E72|nr:pyrimidine (deoxy)nucleoside triphosphate diphosphatase [Pantoea sp. 1.19]
MTAQVLDVVAGIITRDGRLLLAQRPSGGDQPGLWEFPGGKVEAGESQQDALRRELTEELGIDARPLRFVASHRQRIDEREIVLHAWHVADFEGVPQRRCHQALRWVTPAEASQVNLAPADVPLLLAFMALAPR